MTINVCCTGGNTVGEKYDHITGDEKVKMCCRDFNKFQGCNGYWQIDRNGGAKMQLEVC